MLIDNCICAEHDLKNTLLYILVESRQKKIKVLTKEQNRRNQKALDLDTLRAEIIANEDIDSVFLDDILEDTFEVKNISQVIRNKLYVALTRSKGDVYIIQKKLFDSVKNNYIIKQ